MFRDNLKRLRREKGMTQKELADRLNVDQSSISKYESQAATIPSDDIKLKMCEIFGVSMDDLMGIDPVASSSGGHELNNAERELIAVYNDLNDIGQYTLLSLARGLKDNPALSKISSAYRAG